MPLLFNPLYGILAGLVIVLAVLLLQLRQRLRRKVKKQRQRKIANHEPEQEPPLPKKRAPLLSGLLKSSAEKWEAEIQQLGQQIIGQIDSKILALRATTLNANRMATRLEILVEQLEQIAQRQSELQQNQAAHDTNTDTDAGVEPARKGTSAKTAAKPMLSGTATSDTVPLADIPLTDMLKEIAEDIGDVRKTILQLPTLTEQLDPEAPHRIPELYEEIPVTTDADPAVNIRHEVEALANFGLSSKDIARKLQISPEETDWILQVGKLIGTIPENKSSPVPLPYPMSEFEFDNFVEADEAQPATTSKTVVDTFKNAPAFKVAVVGVGQCGNNLATAFHRIGYRRVLLLNTAQTDLDSIEDQIAKLPIDRQGAGKDPAVGKARVEAKATQIRNGMLREFGEDFEKIIVCIGLGGGTGSGGGPAVINLAQDVIRSRGGDPAKDVIVITTLPDPNVDGPRQCFNAIKAYGQMVNMGVPMTIIDNAQVGSIIRAKLADGWTPINMWIARTFHMFNAYANRPSDHGAFDGNDLNDVIRRGRLLFAAFRVSQLKDKYAIADVMAANLERSLFARCNTKTAVAAGCLMVINPRVGNDLTMEDITPALQELNNIMQPSSTLHRGIYIPNDWTSQDIEKNPDLFCYVILGGLDHPLPTLNGLFEKAKNYDQSYDSVAAFLSAENGK
jgi:cell division GTPase FtsZ